MTQPDTDASVLAHIQRLVSEEHRRRMPATPTW